MAKRKAQDSADQYLANFSRTMKQSKSGANAAFERLAKHTKARFEHADNLAFERLAGRSKDHTKYNDEAYKRLAGHTSARHNNASEAALRALAGKETVRERFERTQEAMAGRKRQRA